MLQAHEDGHLELSVVSLKASGVILGLGGLTWLPLPIPTFYKPTGTHVPHLYSGDWVSDL